MDKIPAWIERMLLPKLNEISGEIKALEAKIESSRNWMISRFDSLEARIPVMEKMAEFEVRLAEIEKKLSVHA